MKSRDNLHLIILTLVVLIYFVILASSTSLACNEQNASHTTVHEYAYIPNYGDGTISVINIATDAVFDTIHVGSNPIGVAVNPKMKRVYVTNNGDNSVSVIDTSSNNVIKTINVGSEPLGVAVSPDGTKVYVANHGEASVSVIDAATNTVIDTWDNVGVVPIGVEATSNGYLYVTHEISNGITVVDTSNGNSRISPVGGFASGVVATQNGEKAYVATQTGDGVFIFNTINLDYKTTHSSGSWPTGVAITPNGSLSRADRCRVLHIRLSSPHRTGTLLRP